MTLSDWNDIRTAPVGPTILLANGPEGYVTVGYGEWFNAPFPRWIACDPNGTGRFKPTHWAEMPTPPTTKAAD